MNEPLFDPTGYYCAPPAASFWSWSYSDDTAIWQATGATIAFRGELEQVLRALACGGCGLPPLSMVLLVFAACRDSWAEMAAARTGLVAFAKCVGLAARDIGSLENGLNKIAHLSPELRHPLEAKLHLLQFLFETGGACRSGEQAMVVCDRLLSRYVTQRRQYSEVCASQQDLCRAWPHLLDGLGRVDEQTLRLRAATGLDDLVRPAEIDVDDWKQTRALISSLLDDQEYGGLARLSRALMAVVHLPRPLWDPEELPMGGFSDIENRGSLDRLLISELAHDDLTLSVRIALNEALYLRRETPPKTPSMARSILIDVGIRMWGVPRVFATAAALALLATTNRRTAATAYRAKGNQIDKAELANRKGLIEHLSCLTPDTHPGRAIAPFLAARDDQAMHTDRIIVTSDEAIADRDFQQCVARQDVDALYLATVNRDGGFRLVCQSPRGRKVICEAKLPLDDLLLQPQHDRRRVPLIDAGKTDRLPAIFFEDPFPLSIPCNRFNYRRSWTVPGYGVFEIANDQRLLWWNTLGHGPQQILDRVPGKALVCAGDIQIRANQWIAVLDQPGNHYELLTVDLEKRRAKLSQLDLEYRSRNSPYAFCVQEGGLLAIASDHVVMLSRSGDVVVQIPSQRESSIETYQLEHRHGRYFVEHTTGVWYALSLNTASAGYRWQKVFVPRQHASVDLVALFDWVGHEGPVGITSEGEIYYPEEKRASALDLRGPIEVLEVSPCGEWVLVVTSQLPWTRCFVSLSSHSQCHAPASIGARRFATGRWVQPIRGHLHRRFWAGGRNSSGHLVLVSTGQQIWSFASRRFERPCAPQGQYFPALGVRVKKFSQRVNLPHGAFRLDRATFEDGSQMYLDSRGLLHLRSSDPGIPETTLVLADGALSGWSADGTIWGNSYFTGHPSNANARDILTEVLEPFARRLT